MITFLIWFLFTAVFAAVGAGLTGCRLPWRFLRVAVTVGFFGGVIGWAARPTLAWMYLAPWAFAIVAAFWGAWLGGAKDTPKARQSGAFTILIGGFAAPRDTVPGFSK